MEKKAKVKVKVEGTLINRKRLQDIPKHWGIR